LVSRRRNSGAADRQLFYHGQFDDSSPASPTPPGIRIRTAAVRRADDGFRLYLIDVSILQAKRKAKAAPNDISNTQNSGNRKNRPISVSATALFSEHGAL